MKQQFGLLNYESKQKLEKGSCTFVLMVFVMAFGLLFSIVEYTYFPILITGMIWTSLSAIFLVCGIALYFYAGRVSSRHTSTQVRNNFERNIIIKGPYSVIRYPIYTGIYLALLGSILFLHSIIGTLIIALGMIIIFNVKIKTEENALQDRFGILYVLYVTRKCKMFPYIW